MKYEVVLGIKKRTFKTTHYEQENLHRKEPSRNKKKTHSTINTLGTKLHT